MKPPNLEHMIATNILFAFRSYHMCLGCSRFSAEASPEVDIDDSKVRCSANTDTSATTAWYVCVVRQLCNFLTECQNATQNIHHVIAMSISH